MLNNLLNASPTRRFDFTKTCNWVPVGTTNLNEMNELRAIRMVFEDCHWFKTDMFSNRVEIGNHCGASNGEVADI